MVTENFGNGKKTCSGVSFILVLMVFLSLFSGVSANSMEPGDIRFEPPTLAVMNSPKAKERIGKGMFQTVFRGMGKRTPEQIAVNELLCFHFLFDTECQCGTLRTLVNKFLKEGLAPAEALLKAKVAHLEVLKKEITKMESLKDLYENYPHKSVETEDCFLFTTPHLAIARTYGPVVMVIEENNPRGLDLNGIAKDSKYYSFGRALQNLAALRWKSIVADYIADRDEYVIPAFIPNEDITGIIVYEPSNVIVMKNLPLVQPGIQRVYRKHFERGIMVIDVLDSQDRLIERLCASPNAPPPDGSVKRSSEKLPPAIRAAWKDYVRQRRHPAGRK